MTKNEELCIIWGMCFGLTIRRWLMKSLIARIMAWFGGDLMQKIIKCIPAIVAEVEKAMVDGKITADERKDLAVKMVNIVAEQFGIKISGIMRWVISVIIDNIAKRLPSKDITIPVIITKAIAEIGG